MSQPLVLVTGFGAFGKVRSNVSGALARALAQQPPPGTRIRSRILPVSFVRAGAEIEAESARWGSDAEAPALIVGLGVQKKRWFRLERRARARLDSARVDVDGAGVDAVVPLAGGDLVSGIADEALLAPLHHRALQPPRLSDDAGGYVCERAFHALLAAGERSGVPALFLHVPPGRALGARDQLPLVSAMITLAARRARPRRG